jgi:hypothetical protein
VTIQVNGGRREENNFMVDGADNIDRGSNLTLLSFPSVDSGHPRSVLLTPGRMD